MNAGNGLGQIQAAQKIAISSEDVLTKTDPVIPFLRLQTIGQFSYNKSLNIDQ